MHKFSKVKYIANNILWDENFVSGFDPKMYHALFGDFDRFYNDFNVISRMIHVKKRIDKYINIMTKYSNVNHIYQFLHNDCGVIGSVYAQTAYAVDRNGRRRSIQEWVWQKGWSNWYKGWWRCDETNDHNIVAWELPSDKEFYARAMIFIDYIYSFTHKNF